MSRLYLGLGCLLAAAAPGAVQAGPYGEALGRCAIGATSETDRTALMRWSFIITASNPALADLSTATPAVRERSVRAVADIFNRIMLRDCRRQSVEAMRREGEAGMQTGFQALGLLAGQEMMMTEGGAAAIEELLRHLDEAGLLALGAEAAAQPPI